MALRLRLSILGLTKSNSCGHIGKNSIIHSTENFTLSFSRPAILGYFPENSGESCAQIKAIEGERAVNRIYWLNATDSKFQVRLIFDHVSMF